MSNTCTWCGRVPAAAVGRYCAAQVRAVAVAGPRRGGHALFSTCSCYGRAFTASLLGAGKVRWASKNMNGVPFMNLKPSLP